MDDHIEVQFDAIGRPLPLAAVDYTAPEDRPTPAAAVALVRRMKQCPYRGLTPPCGCQGARCALRHGAVVGFDDCRRCLEAYEPLAGTGAP